MTQREFQPDGAFELAQYTALREEVLARVRLSRQLVSIAAVAFAALIGIAAQHQAIAALAYPPVAFFLLFEWHFNAVRISELGWYIRTHYEEDLSGWETYLYRTGGTAGMLRRLPTIGAKGIFAGTQALSLATWWLLEPRVDTLSTLAVVFAGIAFVLTIVTCLFRAEPRDVVR